MTLDASIFSRIRREAGDSKVTETYRKRALELREGLFHQQVDLIHDPWRFKAARCTRRAGKSTTAIRYMCIVAVEVEQANIQYITLTAKKARKEVWPGLKRACRKFNLQCKFNEMTLTVLFANGSVINLDGCENISDVDKFRGSDDGYNLVIIDECKSFEADMFAELVDEAITPALSDRAGTLLIIGTPGRFLSGRFYEITSDRAAAIIKRKDQIDETDTYTDEYEFATSRPWDNREEDGWKDVQYAWSFHKWSTKDNVAMPHIWRDQLATKRRNKWGDDEPIWRREYRGEWVADDAGYVYAYLSERNDWEPDLENGNEFGLPSDHEWIYVEGSDLGFDDEFAIEVVAWSETTNVFYLGVHEYTMPGMDVPAIAKAFNESESKFGSFNGRCGDRGGLGKTIFATLGNQYDIEIEPAEKHEKRDFQELLNSELRAGRAKVRKGSKLARQMSMLQWKPDHKTEDKASSPKDACDAALYSWRYIYSAYAKAKPVPLVPDSPQFVVQRMAEYEQRLQQREQQKLAESRAYQEDDIGDWTD